MAGREHRRFDRRTAAVVTVVAAVALLAAIGRSTIAARAEGATPKSSQAGDACPLRSHTANSDTALDGVVAFDRSTGEVRWTNVAPNGSQLGHRGETLVIVREDDGSERVVDPRTGAVTSCGDRHDDVVVDRAGASRSTPRAGARFDLGPLEIEAAGDGADVRAIAPDGAELWATDAGSPAAGGLATVELPIHAAALTPDGRTVVVLTGTALRDPD